MRDRVSTKILNNGATRYGVYDEDGKLLRYEYIKLEDEPSTEGDFFNKANMLPDSIPKLLGLKMSNPQVADALNVLANVGNLYVWERVQTYAEEVPAGYTLGPSKQIELIKGKNNSGNSISYRTITVSYSSSISVSENGDNITLNSPSTVNLRPDYPDEGVVLRGKFIQVTQWDSTYVDTVSGVLFIQSDASFADDYPNSLGWHSLTCSSAQVVTGTPAIPAGTTTDYLTSTDPNAYPKQSAAGGQDAYYTLGDAVTGEFIISTLAMPTVDYKYHVSSSVVVSEDGTVHLSGDYITVNFSHGYAPTKSDFAGKFVQYYGRSSSGETDSPPDKNPPFNSTPSQIVYVPNDVNITIANPSYIDRYQPVTGHAAIPASTTITYLGQLGEPSAKIEVGSYVGTGVYGESNPNTITFDFAPKLVWIIGPSNGLFNVTNTPVLLIYDRTYYNGKVDNTSGVLNLSVTWGDKFVSYYYKSGFNGYEAVAQLNDNGKTYSYIAIG